LYASPNIIRVIKSRRIRWARYVAHIGQMRNAYKIVVGKPDGKRLLGRYWFLLEVILERILQK
jgi:hypothetical protein